MYVYLNHAQANMLEGFKGGQEAMFIILKSQND